MHPYHVLKMLGNPGGTRTLNLEIRSLTPYPVGPQGLLCMHRISLHVPAHDLDCYRVLPGFRLRFPVLVQI